MTDVPNHAWEHRFERAADKRVAVIGFSRHQGCWSVYLGSVAAGVKEGGLQAMGGAFEDPEEGKASIDKFLATQGWTAIGGWEKVEAGVFEDTE
jgi:hypothetical protein